MADPGGLRVAYVVLAHRLPAQLARLVRALTSDASRFYLHIDRTAPREVHTEARALLTGRSDVAFLRPRSTPWASFELVRATLDGIRSARDAGADTVVILSGQDYPIKPTPQILAFLAAEQGRSFIELFPLPRPDWPHPGGLERYDARGVRVLGTPWWWKDRRATAWLPRRRIDLSPWVPHQGSPICILHAAACDHLMRLLGEAALQRVFRAVAIPDEAAIHTVLANSPLRGDLVPDNLLYADWSADGPHPEILRPDHLPALVAAPGLFARKFDLLAEPATLDLVDVQCRQPAGGATGGPPTGGPAAGGAATGERAGSNAAELGRGSEDRFGVEPPG